MSKDKDEDFFEKGFDAIIAEVDQYLAEKAKREKERKNNYGS